MKIDFKKLRNNTLEIESNSINDLGLLVERHIQNRYHEKDYKYLIYNVELVDLVLDDESLNDILYYLFYHIICKKTNIIIAIRSLGYFYGFDILNGLKNISLIYKDEDDILYQLILSMTGLYDIREIYFEIKPFFDLCLKNKNLPKTNEQIKEIIDFLNSINSFSKT